MSDHKAFSLFKMLSSAVERLKACDDAFRKQLEQERQAFEQQVQTLTNEKQREIEQANTRVRCNAHFICETFIDFYFYILSTHIIPNLYCTHFALCNAHLKTLWLTPAREK